MEEQRRMQVLFDNLIHCINARIKNPTPENLEAERKAREERTIALRCLYGGTITS